jgi:hypothetical protein
MLPPRLPARALRPLLGNGLPLQLLPLQSCRLQSCLCCAAGDPLSWPAHQGLGFVCLYTRATCVLGSAASCALSLGTDTMQEAGEAGVKALTPKQTTHGPPRRSLWGQARRPCGARRSAARAPAREAEGRERGRWEKGSVPRRGWGRWRLAAGGGARAAGGPCFGLRPPRRRRRPPAAAAAAREPARRRVAALSGRGGALRRRTSRPAPAPPSARRRARPPAEGRTSRAGSSRRRRRRRSPARPSPRRQRAP